MWGDSQSTPSWTSLSAFKPCQSILASSLTPPNHPLTLSNTFPAIAGREREESLEKMDWVVGMVGRAREREEVANRAVVAATE